MKTMTNDDFRSATGVSRETLARLETYADLLVKWQARINLVGPATIPDLWRRHMLDSAQLFPHIPRSARILVDLGSGAGFPGLVLAAMGVPEVHLVDSDVRKCAFLREAARVMGLSVTVHAKRISEAPAVPADVVTARALAPLADLLDLAEKFLRPHTMCLFLKGRTADEELTAAAKDWTMQLNRTASTTDPAAAILELTGVRRAGAQA